MSDQGAFWLAIEAEPTDFTRYGVFADWLDDRALSPVLAYAFRWMARRQLRPFHRLRYHYTDRKSVAVAARYSWAWYTDTHAPAARKVGAQYHAKLPRIVFLAGGTWAEHRLFGSMAAAIDNLAIALEHLRVARELDAPA